LINYYTEGSGGFPPSTPGESLPRFIGGDKGGEAFWRSKGERPFRRKDQAKQRKSRNKEVKD